MINYLGKKYKDIRHLADSLGVRQSMASHLYHCNGGTCDDTDDLKHNNSVIEVVEVKEEKVDKRTTKELKVTGKKTKQTS